MHTQNIWSLLAAFVVLVLFYYLHMVLHELGHLAGGLLSGYRFGSIRFGTFILLKANGKLRCKRYSLVGTGGQCLMIPPPYRVGFPVLLYNLGGSLANFAAALLGLGLFFWTGNLLCLLFICIGLLIAGLNGIPMQLGGIYNDGYNAFCLNRRQEAAWGLWVQLQVYAKLTEGVRLRDMPAEWFAVRPETLKIGLCASVAALACGREMDQLQLDQAELMTGELLNSDSGLMGAQRLLLTVDLLTCKRLRGAHKTEMEQMRTPEFEKFLKASRKNPSVLRLLYIEALLGRKNTAAAAQHLMAFEKLSKNYPYEATLQNERELIAIADEQWEKQQAAVPIGIVDALVNEIRNGEV